MVHASRGDHERVVELATENLAAVPADWQYKFVENTAHTYLFDRFCLIGTLAYSVDFLKRPRTKLRQSTRRGDASCVSSGLGPPRRRQTSPYPG